MHEFWVCFHEEVHGTFVEIAAILSLSAKVGFYIERTNTDTLYSLLFAYFNMLQNGKEGYRR